MKKLVKIGNSNNNNNKDYLTELPFELIEKISINLSFQSLLNLNVSSKFFNRHLSDIVKKEFNKMLKKIKITTEGESTFILDSEGQVWVCGDNRDGNLGVGDKSDRLKPERLSFSEPVVQVAAGLRHTFFQLKSGKVLSCGKNHAGQLGWGCDDLFYCQPQEVLNLPSNIKDIVADKNCTYFLTNEGKIWGCGGFYLSPSVPYRGKAILLELSFPVKQVATRDENTFLLLENGDVLGSSDSWIVSELSGLEDLSNTNGKFKKLPIKGVKQITLGNRHVLFLREDGVWGCGDNSCGQLGFGGDIEIKNKIEKLPIGLPVKEVFAGRYNSFFLLENGEIWACGDNYFGQLGVNHKDPEYEPVKLPIKPHLIIGVSAHHTSTIFLGKNGKVYGCGRNHGSLGLGTVEKVGSTIIELPALTECLGLNKLLFKRMENKNPRGIAQEKESSEDQNNNSKHSM